MSLSAAPFHGDLAEGPPGGQAHWLTTEDGIRIRAGLWPCPGARGTLFLLPGRTEYIEKYGRTAADFRQAGFAVLSLDWRGQGLAQRLAPERMIGHVGDFAEYQRDMAALIAHARALGLPEPYFLLAHSMGGCIGLRSLMGAHPFRAAAFSAPMWGIRISALMRPIATALSHLAPLFGQAHRLAPGTQLATYVLQAEFAGNTLTTDADFWRYMARQAAAAPELTLGGPSLGWLRAALVECQALTSCPSPQTPCLTALGGAEKIVDPAPIHRRMSRWPGGNLLLYPGCEHEVLMEATAYRQAFCADVAELFTHQA